MSSPMSFQKRVAASSTTRIGLSPRSGSVAGHEPFQPWVVSVLLPMMGLAENLQVGRRVSPALRKRNDVVDGQIVFASADRARSTGDGENLSHRQFSPGRLVRELVGCRFSVPSGSNGSAVKRRVPRSDT